MPAMHNVHVVRTSGDPRIGGAGGQASGPQQPSAKVQETLHADEATCIWSAGPATHASSLRTSTSPSPPAQRVPALVFGSRALG